MAHQVETMAYNGVEKPWHGLGNPVSADMTVEEMLQAAGLDWENVSRPIYVQQDDGTFITLESLNKDNTAYRAILRTSDGYCHKVMTDEYNIVQNKEVMEFFREYTEAGGMKLETAGALKHGSLIWVLAKIEAAQFTIGNDLNQTYVLLSNSHDGSQEFQGQFTSVRVVCANTIRMAQAGKKGRSFSLSHASKMTPEILSQAKRQLGLAIEQTEKFAEVARTFSSRKMDTQETYQFVAKLVQPKLLETKGEIAPIVDALIQATEGTLNQSILATEKRLDASDFTKVGKGILLDIMMSPGSELESSADTLWGVLNGVTRYVDHNAGKDRDRALTSAWFGPNAELKDKAYNLALEYVR